ncbi:PD-(D/E)XK nuclease family protein [Patescibacteria group bacterium]|nr:PD-(D/E)XK nuclease family protein [Patescibacteria group bacterium]
MTLDYFKHKYGYEVEGVWMPRVTAITSLTSRPFFVGSYRSADWGNMVHSAIEKILKGEPHDGEKKIGPSLHAFEKWRRAHAVHITNPAADIECRVYDFENGYAGTIDMIAEVKGKRGIVDLKTGNGIRDEYSLQTAAYLNAYNKGALKKLQATTRWILRIDQYEECKGCFAKKKEKDGKERISGGNEWCNHQWSLPTGEAEFLELEGQEEDLKAFLAAKEVWEWYHRSFLRKVANYPKNSVQKVLI